MVRPRRGTCDETIGSRAASIDHFYRGSAAEARRKLKRLTRGSLVFFPPSPRSRVSANAKTTP
jgi:hypothetical protein